MLTILTALPTHGGPHHNCMHDRLSRGRRASVARQQRRLQETPSPLRVVFNLDPLDADPEHACASVGQVVAVGAPAAGAVGCDATVLDNCYFTCTEAHVLTDGGRAALGRLLPAVGAFLGAAFAIRAPIVGRLNVTDRPCGFGGDVRVPPAVLADGVADADVVIFVTARPIPSDALAFAGHCQSDQGATDPYVPMRPLVGHVNVDPAELGALDATAWADDERRVDGVLKVLLHETFHVLGFTYDKIRELPCPDAPSYDRYQPSTWEPRPCAAAGSRDPVAVHRVTTGGYAHDERRVHTPKVVEAARRHFDCAEAAEQAADPLYTCASGECIDGAALEDAGGEGTNGSHWEKRLFLGETMCGTTQDGETSAVSALTLALFEDAGWYRPDYAVAAPKCFFDASWCAAADGGREAREPLRWGAGQGCGFLGSCDGDAWDGDGYWCEAPAAEGCTVGRVALGYCTLGQYSGKPADFRQYVGLPENAGGRPTEDYCPITAPYRDWDCRYPPRELDNALTAAAAALGEGQARGPSARCFASSLHNTTVTLRTDAYFGCYEHRCLAADRLQLRVSGQWLDCAAYEGGALKLAGWVGELVCPNATELCAGADDLEWPIVTAVTGPGDVTPAAGPTSGGTEITIVGTALGGGGRGNGTSRSSSRVYVCGIDAEVLSWKEVDGGGERLIARTGAAGDAAGSELCAGPAAASSLRCAEAPGNHTCHVRVLASEGRSFTASRAYVYLGPPPPLCDLSGGWDADSLVCVTLAIWPWVLVVLLALTAARWAYSIATDAATTRRSRLFFRKRAAVENTPLRERTGGTRASGAGSQVWT